MCTQYFREALKLAEFLPWEGPKKFCSVKGGMATPRDAMLISFRIQKDFFKKNGEKSRDVKAVNQGCSFARPSHMFIR